MMLVLAHRGYHVRATENTIAAFEAAVALGVDGIETDVRLSGDGKPVIIHDRVSPCGRAVSGITHRELENDVGHAVPVLGDILEAFPDVLWNIEIKNPEACLAAVPVLRAYAGRRRLLVTSFRHDVVSHCANALHVECGLLLAHRPLDVDAIVAGCAAQPHIRVIVWDYNAVDEAVLAAVTAMGWANYVYGAVTPAEHARCAQPCVDGLISDYPELAFRARS